MHKINQDKAQMFRDAVQSYGILTLRCSVLFLGKELGSASLILGMCEVCNGSLRTLFLLFVFVGVGGGG